MWGACALVCVRVLVHERELVAVERAGHTSEGSGEEVCVERKAASCIAKDPKPVNKLGTCSAAIFMSVWAGG